jgi:hypothetical protein
VISRNGLFEAPGRLEHECKETPDVRGSGLAGQEIAKLGFRFHRAARARKLQRAKEPR